MKAFIDARCSKCGKKIGWFGELSDKPACSKCGHKDVISAADQKAFDEVEERLRKEMLDKS